MKFSEMSLNENYIFIDDIEDSNKMKFNLRGHRTFLYRDTAAPAFKKIPNGSNFLFESGYLINDTFVNCPLKIQNVTINYFEIISHRLYSKLNAYVDNENNNRKNINIEIITSSEFNSLPCMIDCLNLYINSGKNLELLDTSVFQSELLFKHYSDSDIIQLINNLKFEFYDIHMFSVGKDDREWTEIYISNLPLSHYLSDLFKIILIKLNSNIEFDAERISIFECQTYDNENEEEIIKDYLKYNIKGSFNPELELLDRMSIH